MNITRYINRVVLLKLETSVSGVEGEIVKERQQRSVGVNLGSREMAPRHVVASAAIAAELMERRRTLTTQRLPCHGTAISLAPSIHRSALSASCRIASRCVAPSRFATIVRPRYNGRRGLKARRTAAAARRPSNSSLDAFVVRFVYRPPAAKAFAPLLLP